MQRTKSEYVELRPPAALAGKIVCFWSQAIEGETGAVHLQSVIPDCCVDIVWINEEAVRVAGPATRQTVIEMPSGTRLYGARFQPGAAADFFAMPMTELLNRDVPLDDIMGRRAAAPKELLATATSASEKRSALLAGMSRLLAQIPESGTDMQFAAAWLMRHPEKRVVELAKRLAMSERHLHRRFSASVGYGPKVFQRIARLQRLLALQRAFGSLAALAYAAGYADQAHLCREAKALAGVSPRSLLERGGSTLELSETFNTAVEKTLSLAPSILDHRDERRRWSKG